MKTPSLLSYNRSLYPTDAVFYATLPDGRRQPIPILCKTTLGTESQIDKAGESKPTGNPQRVEFAALPFECDTLGIEFHLTVLGASLVPMSCDVPEWRSAAIAMAEAYKAKDGFRVLGHLYAANILNGRWAWKNRMFADAFSVSVAVGGEVLTSKALAHRLDDFTQSLADPTVQKLGDLIAAGLAGGPAVRLTVTGSLHIGLGATVFPSQEFVKKDDADDAIGKVLFGIVYAGIERCAAFHEQKIGAALRSIDIFHKGTEGVPAGKPLPVNPYGQDRDAYVVVRSRSAGNPDFYGLMKANIKKFGSEPQLTDEFHFVMANLVRGGVFSYGSNNAKREPQEAA